MRSPRRAPFALVLALAACTSKPLDLAAATHIAETRMSLTGVTLTALAAESFVGAGKTADGKTMHVRIRRDGGLVHWSGSYEQRADSAAEHSAESSAVSGSMTW